jgi:peptidyl-prolyl cis-trans isomerase D
MFKLNVGEMSDVIESDGERALFRLDEIVPPRTPSLDEVRTELKQLYMATKTQEAATKAAEDVVAAVKGGATFEAAAAKSKMASQTLPLLTRQQQGLDPAILGAVFAQDVGATAVVQDSRGEPWVVRVDSSTPASPEIEAQIRTQVSQQINQSISGDIGEAFLRGVQKAVKLKTNDSAINKYLSSFTQTDETQ